MNTEWQKIDRKDFVQEYFWPGEFIQSDTWNETAPPEFEQTTYPYLKDDFGTKYTFHNEIHVTEVTYATSFENMVSIIDNGGFTSQQKHYPGIGSMPLVWFGLKIGERQIDCLKKYIKYQMKDAPERNVDIVLDQVARTPAFQPISLYGHFKFTIGIQEVMNAYKTQFCHSPCNPEIRKLGTFAYKQEIMHAILVYPPDTCTDLPPLDDTVIQHDDTFETLTWMPHSTRNNYVLFQGNGNPLLQNIRWEQVRFAFYVPEDRFSIPNLERCVSLCLERKKWGIISGVNEDIHAMLDLIESTEVSNRKSVADTLISMIAAYLKDERLYEKTMVKNSFEANICIQLEPVVECVRELLQPMEFGELDWGPLTEWMNSLTRHSNVLRDIQKASIRW